MAVPEITEGLGPGPRLSCLPAQLSVYHLHCLPPLLISIPWYFLNFLPPTLHGPITTPWCSLRRCYLRKVLPNFWFAWGCNTNLQQMHWECVGKLCKASSMTSAFGFQKMEQWCHSLLNRKNKPTLFSGSSRKHFTQRLEFSFWPSCWGQDITVNCQVSVSFGLIWKSIFSNRGKKV